MRSLTVVSSPKIYYYIENDLDRDEVACDREPRVEYVPIHNRGLEAVY